MDISGLPSFYQREIFVCYPYGAPPLDLHAFLLKTHLLI